MAVTDPATGEVIATVPDLGAAETERAIEAAHARLPAVGRAARQGARRDPAQAGST